MRNLDQRLDADGEMAEGRKLTCSETKTILDPLIRSWMS